jgi:hypothetical protein
MHEEHGKEKEYACWDFIFVVHAGVVWGVGVLAGQFEVEV